MKKGIFNGGSMKTMKSNLSIILCVMLLISGGLLISCHMNRPVLSSPESPGQITPLFGPFKSDSLVGYWKSRNDELITHITGLEHESKGAGSFRDADGRVYHAQKFQDIRYLGGNKWECMEWDHPHNLNYDQSRAGMGWHKAVIEMIDFNTIKVGNTIYDRT